MDAFDLALALRSRELTARAVMEAFLDRIEADNPRIIVSLRSRADLRADAGACDRGLALPGRLALARRDRRPEDGNLSPVDGGGRPREPRRSALPRPGFSDTGLRMGMQFFRAVGADTAILAMGEAHHQKTDSRGAPA
jgi:Asp-tRNA(Asn)/Glu-tRNA(Gln) amidotransferase A subunit family amidase